MMAPRLRKLIGTVVLVAFVTLYSLVVMAIGAPIMAVHGHGIGMVFYAIAGLVWTVPAGAVIWWMERKPKT